MIFFVYILQCADKSYYVGCTNNIERRLKQHNQLKSGAHYTKIRRPVNVVYFEKYESLSKARKREAEIKSWRRKDKEMLVGGSLGSDPEATEALKLGKTRVLFDEPRV